MTFHDILVQCAGKSYDDWKNTLLSFELTKKFVLDQEGFPQSTYWHPEFDLLKHIYLVFTSIYRQKMENLYEAAFLHDIGKIYTTNIGKDKIYSFGHAEKSVEIIDSLKDHFTFYDITREVSKDHMKWENPSDPCISNNWFAKEFVKADKVMSKILFYEFFYTEEEANIMKELEVYEAQNQANKSVIIAIGISGSGKSTYLRNNFDNNLIVCPDEIRRELGNISNQSNNQFVWTETPIRMKKVLEQHDKVVLDATNVSRYQRISFMSKFNGFRKVALVFHVDPVLAFSRVQKDIEGNVARSNVPESVVNRQFANLKKGYKSLIHEFNEVKEFGDSSILEDKESDLEFSAT